MKKTRTLLLALSLGLCLNATANAADPPANWLFSFDNGKGDPTYYSQPQDAYLFDATGGTGVITFNSALASQGTLEVKGAFKMVGDKFTINTNGVNVVFSQAMANYNTDFTVQGAGGSITTQADAAFKSVTIESGSLNIGSQIGVMENITVQSSGSMTVESSGRLLLTSQIINNGTVQIDGLIDASNLSGAAAQAIGVSFVDLDKHDPAPNGYLKSGTWEIASGNGTTTAGDNAKLVLADRTFSVNKETGEVTIPDSGLESIPGAYTGIWFQNDDTLAGVSPMTQTYAPVTFVVNSQPDKTTTVQLEGPLMEGCPIYIASGTNAKIDLWALDGMGGFHDLKVLSNSNVEMTGSLPGPGAVDTMTFIGQNINLVVTPDPYTQSTVLTPLNLILESASSATLDSDLVFYYGAFDGESFKVSLEKHLGHLSLKGQLTVTGKSRIDLRLVTGGGTEFAKATSSDKQYAYGVTFEEEFAHMTMTEYAALVLNEDSAFLASSVTNDSQLTSDGKNLDTTRTAAQATILQDKKLDVPEGIEKYEVNGTVEVKGVAGKATSITALEGEDSAHYTTRNQLFQISNAKITVTDAMNGDESYSGEKKHTTISNVLIGDSVTNAKQNNGTVTLDNEKNQNFDTLYADQGDIAITNNTSVNAETVHLGAGREVSVSSTAVTPEQLLRNGSLTVTTLLKADGYQSAYSEIGADLNLAVGATLNVSAANGTGGIDMQDHKVAFGGEYSGAPLTLSTDDYAQAWAMEKGGKYDLFFDVSAFDYGDGAKTAAIEPGTLDASLYFSNFKAGWFYLCYSGANEQGGNGGNVGTIYLYSMVPEPTTGTLSLLALAGLCLRRRRK